MKKNRPQLVFLDAGTVNYGDLSLKPLEACGDLKVFHSTRPDQITARLKKADIVITNKCVLTGELLRALKSLRCIALTATGTNNVDLEAAKKRGIAVTHVPGYSTETVAQNTIGLMLALAGNIVKFNQAAHDGTWSRSPFFVYGAFPIHELKGKKLGILGYGSIGKRVGEIAKALGMELMISRIPGRSYLRDKVKRRAFKEVIRQADVITIHAPLSPLTRNLIDAGVLRKMKPGAFLLNMARGGIVNEPALAQALKSNHLGGAALDVLTEEPPPRNHVLLGCPNLILMPHVSWASREVRIRLLAEVAQNIRAYLRQKKRYRVV